MFATFKSGGDKERSKSPSGRSPKNRRGKRQTTNGQSKVFKRSAILLQTDEGRNNRSKKTGRVV